MLVGPNGTAAAGIKFKLNYFLKHSVVVRPAVVLTYMAKNDL